MKYTEKQARDFYKTGQYEKAYAACSDIIKDNPKNGRLYCVLAYLEMRLNNNLDKAQELLEKAKIYESPQGFYYRVYGDLLWRKGKLYEAVNQYERSVENNPSVNNLEAFAEGLSFINDNRASDVWQCVLKENPRSKRAYLYFLQEKAKIGDWDAALEMSHKAEDLAPNDAEVLFGVGCVYYDMKQYERALEYYIKAKNKDYSQKAQLYSSLAACYLGMNNYLKALEHVNLAMDFDKNCDYVKQILELCREHILYLRYQQKYTEVYPMKDLALETWPKDSLLLAYMAILEMAYKHDYEQGKSYMNKALSYKNNDQNTDKNTEIDILYEIKGTLWWDYLDVKEEGLACMEKAITLNPKKYNLNSLASRIIDVDSKRATKLFEQALQLEPDDVDAMYGLARIALKEGAYTKGLELAKKCYAIKPSDADINLLMGYAYFELKQFKEALELYLKVVDLGFPDMVYVYESVMECYQQIGDQEAARMYAKKILDIKPDNPKAQRILSDMT